MVKKPLPLDLRKEAILRGKAARYMNFDTALQMELQEYGRKYIKYFLWGYIR